MAVFDFITNPPEHLITDADEINNRYFTVDTADMVLVHQWLDYNPYIVCYALLNGEVLGFFNIMPITDEAAALFDRQDLREEDLDIQYMLPPERIRTARFAYLAAIAIKDTHSYIGRQCAAGLLAVLSSYLLHGYKHLERIYANPTTFQGNALVRKLGLQPLRSFKKPLGKNDIYIADMDRATRDGLRSLVARYGRFVGINPWQTPTQMILHPVDHDNLLHAEVMHSAIVSYAGDTVPPFVPARAYLATYAGHEIGLVMAATSDMPLWYGLHPRQRGHGLADKLKAVAEALTPDGSASSF